MSDAHRWQAATGAIAGSLLADARAGVCSQRGHRSTELAEDLLGGSPTPIDLAAADAIPVAVGLSGGPAPLLSDPVAVELVGHLRWWLENPASQVPGADRFDEPALSTAARIAATALDLDQPGQSTGPIGRFEAALVAAGDDRQQAVLIGGLMGLHGGIGAIPARSLSGARSPDGRLVRRYVSRLVDRLLGLHRNDWYDPRTRRGPKEVLAGVWLSNLYGIEPFVSEHPGGLVLSLCDVEGRLDSHPNQVAFHIDDTPRPDANPQLPVVLDEVLGEVRGARSVGQPVLVHCRHGASRTGLVLRLMLMTDLGLDPESATTEAQCLWPHTSTWNKAWANEIERRYTG